MKAQRWTAELRDRLEVCAHMAGFAAMGVARVAAPEEPGTASASRRFSEWVAAGHAADMGYLVRRDQSGELVRGALHRVMPWARSVVVCAWNYNAEGPYSIDPAAPDAGWIARYAWMGSEDSRGASGPLDYHDVLLDRLRVLEAELLGEAECTTRCYVDTGPILERDFAARAGIGWIGKNTCVLNQELGSWLLLAVIVTSLPIEEQLVPLLAPDRCGTCTRCIDACPTEALLAGRDPTGERQIDASRCVAYLTIEKKGSVPEDLRQGMGRNVFGCDICQEVCPWNRRAPVSVSESVPSRSDLKNPPLERLAGMGNAEFKRQFSGSPLERTGRKRLLRNVAIAMGNSGEERFLEQLDLWAAAEPAGPADLALRDATVWAAARIRARVEARAGENASASLEGNVDRHFQSDGQ